MGTPARPAWIPRLALALASLTICLTAVELTLRYRFPVRGMTYQLDDRYLYRQIPGSRKLAAPIGQEWRKVLVRINEAGRRGDEAGYATAPHRVVVYGDSFIAAEYTPDGETFVDRLETHLAQAGLPTKALNAGVVGYGVDQELLRIEDDLPVLKPHLVIVAICAFNDFGDLLRNKLFRLAPDGRLEGNRPVLSRKLVDAFDAPFRRSSVQVVRAAQFAYDRWFSRPSVRLDSERSTAGDWTSRQLDSRRREYEQYVVAGSNEVDNLLADGYDADVSLEPDSPSARYRVALMRAVLGRIRDRVLTAGSKLLVIVIPERCDVVSSCGESEARRRYPNYRPTNLTDPLEAILKDEAIPYMNLFDAIKASGREMYLPVDPHWTSDGQDVVARWSTDAIAKGGLLGSPAVR